MNSNIEKVLARMNELELKMDEMNYMGDRAEDEEKTKAAHYNYENADAIKNQIKGMASCLKMLGLCVWRKCGYDTGYTGVWRIPLDDMKPEGDEYHDQV